MSCLVTQFGQLQAKGIKMKINEMLIKALTTYNDTRERSMQKEIGVSQVGGCRRQVWLQLQDTPKENSTLKLPALMGTAIHKMIEEALVKENAWDDYLIEQEFSYGELKGHIDLYVPSVGAVIDWKTTKLKNLDYFPSKQQRWQVQLYAYLLEKNGHTPKTVTLVGIPRDGDERQIKMHTENYSEEIALEAWSWLQDVVAQTEAPAPERYAAQFCSLYCPYFGNACGGKGKDTAVETISDNETISAVARYVWIDKQIKELTEQKDGIKVALENVSGTTPDGVTVNWSQVAGRKTIDEKALTELLGDTPVPYKQGDPTMRLSVK